MLFDNVKKIGLCFSLLAIWDVEIVLANDFKVTIINDCKQEGCGFNISGSAIGYLSENWYNSIPAKCTSLSANFGENKLELFFSPRESLTDDVSLSLENHRGKFDIFFVANRNWSGVVYIPCLCNPSSDKQPPNSLLNGDYKIDLLSDQKKSYIIRISLVEQSQKSSTYSPKI